MTESLILHHRYTSPYSEKVRLLLGHAGLTWQSVHAPFTPPRPAIDPLLGGYRRIPVAHIGADVFCDSRVICDEIARMAGKPELSPFGQPGDIRSFLEDVESRVYAAVLGSMPVLGALTAMARKVPCWKWPTYLADKRRIMGTASLSLPPRLEADLEWKTHLRDLDERLAGTQFLFGRTEPSIADFTAVHLVWFRLDMEGPAMFNELDRLADWYGRMTAMGHGRMKRITMTESLQTVAASTPRAVPDAMSVETSPGRTVEVTPTDTMPTATRGELVGEDEHRWIVARRSDAGGRIHAHFPKGRFRMGGARPEAE